MSRREEHIVFEYFELSPLNKSAMGSARLTRTFPGYASQIPVSSMESPDLRKSLASTIAKMATQKAPGFQPQIRKNGEMMDESRDTTHPGLVTDFLFNITTALGNTTDVQRVVKYTREEVLWNDTLYPWRRSPLWLLLRVSLQLLCTRESTSKSSSGDLYKAFMIFMVARVLKTVRQKRLLKSQARFCKYCANETVLIGKERLESTG